MSLAMLLLGFLALRPLLSAPTATALYLLAWLALAAAAVLGLFLATQAGANLPRLPMRM